MASTSSGLRQRRGYSPLDQQEEETSPSLDIAGDWQDILDQQDTLDQQDILEQQDEESQDPEPQTSESAQDHAWFSLTWSFLVSSVLTVFTSNSLSGTEVQASI
jgi:hypothetical protein